MSEIQLPEAFLKLGEVLEQGQFELLFTEEKLRLVYLMNDAVESFLVFENARMTGQYREDYEGELEAELSVTEEPWKEIAAGCQGFRYLRLHYDFHFLV